MAHLEVKLHVFTRKLCIYVGEICIFSQKKCYSQWIMQLCTRKNVAVFSGMMRFAGTTWTRWLVLTILSFKDTMEKTQCVLKYFFHVLKRMYYKRFPLASWGDSASQHPAISCATFRAFTVPLKFGARSQGWIFWCCHSCFKPMYLCMPRTKKYTMQSNHIKLNPMLMSGNRVSCLPF